MFHLVHFGMLRAFIPLSHFVSQSLPNPGTAILSESCLHPSWGQISMPKDAAAVSTVAEAGKGLGNRMWQI